MATIKALFVLSIFSCLHLGSAIPTASLQSISASKRQASSSPSATIDTKRYLHNCGGYVSFEKEAWDTAHALAEAGTQFSPNNEFQQDADLWMGPGSNSTAFGDRIIINFRRALDLAKVNRIWPDQPLDIWCREVGPDGLPPKPDGLKGSWSGACDAGTFAYTYIRNHAYWFFPGYTTVLCPRFWQSVPFRGMSLPGKQEMSAVLSQASENASIAANPDILSRSRGQTYLHEFMHYDGLVGNPAIDDLTSKTGLSIYGGQRSARLAQVYGCAQNPAGAGREWGSTVNAENYALLADSIFFRQKLGQSKVVSPVNPPEEIPASAVGPPLSGSTTVPAVLGVGEAADQVYTPTALDDIPFILDNVPVPVYEPPPAPPICIPSTNGADLTLFNNLAATFCKMIVPNISQGQTFDQTSLSPQVSDAKIKAEFIYSSAAPTGSCALSCIDTYTNLTKTCQFDTHTLTGSSNVTMGCGTFSYEIMAP